MKTIDALLQHKIMGLVRTNDQATGEAMAEAMVNAGIRAIEITLTTPGALNIVEKLSANKALTVGVGTVLTKKEVKESAKAGAAFIVSPNADAEVIDNTKNLNLVSMPGIATATEVGQALKAGADILKLFPASTYGPAHLKALRDPYPGKLWCPTGGISLGTVDDWFAAGANLIGLGGPLTRGGVGKVSENVTAFLNAVSSVNKVGQ